MKVDECMNKVVVLEENKKTLYLIYERNNQSTSTIQIDEFQYRVIVTPQRNQKPGS